MPKQPLTEVFGFPVANAGEAADRYRAQRLCPFNNKVPSCTKDKAQDPLGVCSVFESDRTAITCPVRFREDWLITDEAAKFFFPGGAAWTSLTEVRLNDAFGKSAGNIDVVLVSYDERGRITDFGSLEVQAVYISGNVRRPFEQFVADPERYRAQDYRGRNYPRPDYLSSSRKRLAPQIIYKGGILHAWGKKQAVALQQPFFETLPDLSEVAAEEAEVAWLLYDLVFNGETDRFRLTHVRTVYTKFHEALDKITRANPGEQANFVSVLQEKLDDKLDGNPPDAPTLGELF